MKIAASLLPSSPASGERNDSQSPLDEKGEGAFADVLAGSKKVSPKSGHLQANEPRSPFFARNGKIAADKPKLDENHAGPDEAQPRLETATDPLSLLMALQTLQNVPQAKPAGQNETPPPRPDEKTIAKPEAKAIGTEEIATPTAAADELLAELAFTLTTPAKGGEMKTPLSNEKADVKKGDIRMDAFPAASAEDAADPTTIQPVSISKPANRSEAIAAVGPQIERQPATNRVTIIAEQNFPALAPYPASQTATSLAGAIASDSGMQQVFSTSAALAQPGPGVTLSSHTLKIELHPAELGMVTANLRLAGGQLSIELTPESHEAHRRLSADTDTLVKSLRGMGFDVDSVTVLQPSIAVNASTRADAPTLTGDTGGRESPAFQSGNSGNGSNNSSGQPPARNRNNDGQSPRQTLPYDSEHAGDDLFI